MTCLFIQTEVFLQAPLLPSDNIICAVLTGLEPDYTGTHSARQTTAVGKDEYLGLFLSSGSHKR